MQANDDGKPRCNGTTRKGLPCTNPPVTAAPVCRMHGGAAPQVKAKAQRRIAEEKAQQALGKLKEVLGPVEPVANPLLALSMLAGEAVRWKDIVAQRVAVLEEMRYKGMSGEQVRAEIVLFERALDRCAGVLANIVRLNIDERLATITDRQGHILAGVITSVLEKLDLGDKVDLARELIAVELERLDA